MPTPMDTDDAAASPSVVLQSQSQSGLGITLHPLVILNMSDHYTRTKMQNPASPAQVIGALVGVQTGRDIEILNSYELPFTRSPDNSIVVDMAYFAFKQDQYKEVFPTLDFLGWYSTGSVPTASDIAVHKQMSVQNESALFLQLDTSNDLSDSSDLPIAIYESVMDIVNSLPLMMFAQAHYKIETTDSETIAVEHVAHAANAQGGSKPIAHLTGQQNAIRMLQSRVQVLVKYLEEVEAGTLPRNHTVLRQLSSLCNRLPTVQGHDFESEFFVDYNDVMLMTFLAAVTKGSHSLSDLVEKTNNASSRRITARSQMRMGGGGMGLMGMGMGMGMGGSGIHM
ncbi:maintenance of mitochondrial structure and function-domain-containing protein [Entophlyctis helioformis]|nr:maintenance of mitochondrial structure and function-domain-containing protein [Entophlyctis helioformis]